jgi:hypothetical protein
MVSSGAQGNSTTWIASNPSAGKQCLRSKGAGAAAELSHQPPAMAMMLWLQAVGNDQRRASGSGPQGVACCCRRFQGKQVQLCLTPARRHVMNDRHAAVKHGIQEALRSLRAVIPTACPAGRRHARLVRQRWSQLQGLGRGHPSAQAAAQHRQLL